MKKQELHCIDEKWNHVSNKLIVLIASIVLLEKMNINESELMMT